MPQRMSPVYRAQTGIIATLILATCALIISTIKFPMQGTYPPLRVFTRSTAVNMDATYSFSYVIVMFTALGVIAVTSVALGISVVGVRSRVGLWRGSVACLVWSWLLLAAIAAPAALPCTRGIVPDPWLHAENSIFYATPTNDLIGHIGRPPWYQAATGVYTNLCSTATQGAAQSALGMFLMGLALTIFPAVAALLIIRRARSAMHSTVELQPLH